jgi:hypothetical protein
VCHSVVLGVGFHDWVRLWDFKYALTASEVCIHACICNLFADLDVLKLNKAHILYIAYLRNWLCCSAIHVTSAAIQELVIVTFRSLLCNWPCSLLILKSFRGDLSLVNYLFSFIYSASLWPNHDF